MRSDNVVPAWAGALAGLVSGAVALGVAQLVAAIVRPEASPVLAVGDAVVDLSPAPVKDFAIETFGENDKTVLIAGMLVVIAVLAAGLGVLARRKLWYGQAGLAVFGAVGVWAVLTRPDTRPLDLLPTLVGVALGIWTLGWLLRRAVVPAPAGTTPAPSEGAETAGGPPREGAETAGEPSHEGAETAGEPSHEGGEVAGGPSREGGEGAGGPSEWPVVRRLVGEAAFDRRRLLLGAAGGIVVAGAAAAAGRLLSGAQSVEAARTGLRLPRAATPAVLPAGTDFRINGLTPFVTRNDGFYRVDTALILPRIDPRAWTLRVHGMVDRPIELTYADLLDRPLTEAYVTLTCVSNEVGGNLTGNARWLGVRLADVLREAGIRPGADMLLSTSDDGWTCGTPVDVVMDGRDALLAVAMNGQPLPVAHGFPVRQVVPGLYGYVSATKWVVDIKVTRFDQDQAYWTPRGWSAKGPIKTESRIDLPRDGATIARGRTTIAGVAWAQHTGIAAVEVRVDEGPWQQARLAAVPGPDTWRQWLLDWDATPGQHLIAVRATDASGYTQTEALADPAPSGATGWHSVIVQVSA